MEHFPSKLRRFKVWAAAGVVLAVVAVPGFLWARKFMLAEAVELILGRTIGLTASARRIDVKPFAGFAHVHDLRVFNTEFFPAQTFLHVPDFVMEVSLPDVFIRGVMRFRKMRLHIEEITVVRTTGSVTNLNQIEFLAVPRPTIKRERQRPRSENRSFLIDELILTVGSIHYLDYSSGGTEPRRFRFDTGIRDKVFRNVTDPEAIIGMIALQISYHSTIGDLGIDVDALGKRVEGALANTTVLVRQGADYIMAKKDSLGEFSPEFLSDRSRFETEVQTAEESGLGSQGTVETETFPEEGMSRLDAARQGAEPLLDPSAHVADGTVSGAGDFTHPTVSDRSRTN